MEEHTTLIKDYSLDVTSPPCDPGRGALESPHQGRTGGK